MVRLKLVGLAVLLVLAAALAAEEARPENEAAGEKARTNLAGAEKEALWFKEQADKAEGQERERLRRQYFEMARKLGTAYGEAREKAARKGDAETAALFARKQAQWLKDSVADPATAPMDDLLLVAYPFYALGEHETARTYYDLVLKRFDPTGNCRGIPDDKLIGLDELVAVMKGGDFKTIDQIKAGREALEKIQVAFLGGPDGASRDYAKAADLISKFLATYKSYGVDDHGRPDKARRGLEELRAELQLRLALLSAASGSSWCREWLAEQARAAGRDEDARKLLREALKYARIVRDYSPRDAVASHNYAVCLLAAGDKASLEEAVRIFAGLRETDGGDWWKDTRGLVEGLAGLGRGKEARDVMMRVQKLTPAAEIDKNWPDFNKVLNSLPK